MARRETVVISDDLDGTPATQTVEFGYKGISYEIDLNDENAEELDKWLSNYISHGRRLGGRKGSSKAASTRDHDPAQVRVWAHEQGIEVSARGRVPADLVAKFHAAS